MHKQVLDPEVKAAHAESKSTQLDSELANLNSDLDITQSERDTKKTSYEEQIKSLKSLIAELKDKAGDVDDRMDAEYNSGLAFSYKFIMSILKKEYPKLKMDKLEAGVHEYMAEQSQGNKRQEGALLSVKEQENEVGDKTPNTNVEAVYALSKITNPPLATAMDSSPVEVVEPSSQDP